MYHALIAVLAHASPENVRLASFSAEPAVIFVYALVVLAFALVWVGNRGAQRSGGDPGQEPKERPTTPARSEASETPAGEPRPRSRAARKRRRRQGHINWIQ